MTRHNVVRGFGQIAVAAKRMQLEKYVGISYHYKPLFWSGNARRQRHPVKGLE